MTAPGRQRPASSVGCRAGLAACAAVAFATLADPVAACAPAWKGGEPVQIASEEALIVWDAERRLEHFVRAATFQGGPATFGFLVPVPAFPEIAEADERVFERIERFFEAQRSEVVDWRFEGLTSFTLRSKSAAVLPAPGVTVLSTARVAGMDAVVLEAESTKALADWLSSRDFDFRPELTAWLSPYVEEHYKIVAFKYARDGSEPRVGTRAVRLSFRTERPFFPYREPRDAARSIPAVFRLHVLSSTSVTAVLGEARAPWGAEVRYSGPFTGEPPPFARIASPWMTMFEEVSQKREVSGDLFLEADPSPRPVAAAARVVEKTWGIPIELVVLAVLVAGVTVTLVVRGRSSGATPP
jgi:hypothetical protein